MSDLRDIARWCELRLEREYAQMSIHVGDRRRAKLLQSQIVLGTAMVRALLEEEPHVGR